MRHANPTPNPYMRHEARAWPTAVAVPKLRCLRFPFLLGWFLTSCQLYRPLPSSGFHFPEAVNQRVGGVDRCPEKFLPFETPASVFVIIKSRSSSLVFLLNTRFFGVRACFQLWRNIWGLETPPCLVNTTKDKSEGWRDRLVVGESRSVPKDKRARMQVAVDGMVEKVRNIFMYGAW